MVGSISRSIDGSINLWHWICINLFPKYRCRSTSRSRSIILVLLCSAVTVHANTRKVQGLNASMAAMAVLQPCSSSEYHSTAGCAPHFTVGEKCIANYGSANINTGFNTCRDNNLEPLIIESLYEDRALMRYLSQQPIWLFIKFSRGKWRYIQNDKEATFFNWAPGEPSRNPGGNRCISYHTDGWHDTRCSGQKLLYCRNHHKAELEKYRYADITGTVEPPEQRYLDGGSNFSVTCIGYPLKENRFYVKGTSLDGNRNITIGANKDCVKLHCSLTTRRTYFWNEGRCIRKSKLTVHILMDSQVDGFKWSCCILDYIFEPCKHMGIFHYLHSPSRPILETSDTDMVLETEEHLRVTCQTRLGSGNVGSVGLISFYDCGNLVATCNFKGTVSDCIIHHSKSKCVELIEVSKRHDTTSGNVLTIVVDVLVSGFLEAATLACFSYNARERWEQGLSKNATDMLAAYSEPIKVTYKPSVPQLSVTYHAPPPIVYKNVELKADCDAHVGISGGLVWTLNSQRGTERFKCFFGSKPPETPRDIEIQWFPKETSPCPDGWVGNIASATCIKVYESENSWEDAQSLCQEDDSALVRIDNSNTLGFLQSILGEAHYWIGFNDLDGDEELNWGHDKDAKTNYTEWATLVEEEVDPPICVSMHGGKWYTHGCQDKLGAVCETAPGSYFSEESFSRDKGPRMRSNFTIMVEEYMESATLSCRVTNPSSTDDLKRESMAFVVKEEPIYHTVWTGEGRGYLTCEAQIGADRSMSIAIFSSKQLKYLYHIDSQKNVLGVIPASEFNINEIDVASDMILVEARFRANERLQSPYMLCYPYKVEVDDVFPFDVEVIASKNRENSLSPLQCSDYEDYPSRNLTGILEPPVRRLLEGGAEFSVTCISHPLNIENVYVKATSLDDSKLLTYEEMGDCQELSCFFKKVKCPKKTTLMVEFRMWPSLDSFKWSCCSVNRGKESCVPSLGVFNYHHSPSRPILETTDRDMVLETEEHLSWTCQTRLGSGDVGSVGLLSFYNCGNLAIACNWRGDEESCRNYSTKSMCAKKMIVARTVSGASGNVLLIQAGVLVSGDLEGASLACFSYNAIDKMKTGASKDYSDVLAAYSAPIKVTYKAAVPQLTVKYHSKPPGVYKDVKLWAVCDAQVGTGGGIEWTLQSSTVRESYKVHYGGNTPPTPPHIEIDTFPKEALKCPEDWIENKPAGTCFKVSTFKNSWEDARKFCQEQDSDLVQIFDSETLGFVHSIIGIDSYWIGLHDMDGKGKLQWLENTSAVVDQSGWATLLERKADPPICVYMSNDKWYTYGCQHKLKAVCETQPGSNFTDGYFDRLKGPRMHSTFIVTVKEYLQSVTLGCRVTNPGGTVDLKNESMPFQLVDPPVFSVKWPAEPQVEEVSVACDAHVGANGTISLAIFSRKQLKYLYVLDSKGLLHSITPTKEFKVETFKAANDRISVRAVLKAAEELESPFMICYPYEVQAEDTFFFDESFIWMYNRANSASKSEGSDSILASMIHVLIIMVLCSMIVLIGVCLSKKEGSGLDGTDFSTTVEDDSHDAGVQDDSHDAGVQDDIYDAGVQDDDDTI